LTDKTTEKSDEWKTSITKIEPNRITIHGYAIDELMGNLSYSEMLYLILKGELPTEDYGKMLDAILVSSVDHGVTPPSTLAALTCVSTGGNLSQALACGILSINKHHGGAVENCQKLLIEGMKYRKRTGASLRETAEKIVSDALSRGKKLPGLGHRIHSNDPRTFRLFEIAESLGFYGEYPRLMKEIEFAYKKVKKKHIPVNVDGAIASILCELKFHPELGNAFFMIARLPGLIAHIFEEHKKQKPMRKINPDNYTYDGPEYRPVP